MGLQPTGDVRALVLALDKWLTAIASRLSDSILMVSTTTEGTQCDSVYEFSRTATGFAIDRNIVVSVAHIAPDQHVCLADVSGNRFSGRVMGIDRRWDIIFIESEKNLNPVNIAMERPPIGSMVLACGMPYGLLRPFFSIGIVSGHKVNTTIDGEYVEGLMIVSTPIMPGMSGGPIANVNGDIVGMIVANAVNTNEFALAIPSKRIHYSYSILNKLGKIAHLRLGVKVVEGLSKGLNGIKGIIVANIYNHRLTDICRIKVGDVILSIDDVATYTVDDLWDALDKAVLYASGIVKIRFYDSVEKKVKECEYPIQ